MKRLSATLALLFYFSILPPLGSTAPVIGDLIVKESPWVDVRAFMDGKGGRPTHAAWLAAPGTTDVTSTIQAAIDNTTSGQVLLFPGGPYAISSTLVYSGSWGTSINLEGTGKDANSGNGVLKWIGAAGGKMLTFISASYSYIKNIKFDGNSLASYGLEIKSGQCAAPATAGSTGVKVKDVVFTGIGGAGSIAISIGSSDCPTAQVSEAVLDGVIVNGSGSTLETGLMTWGSNGGRLTIRDSGFVNIPGTAINLGGGLNSTGCSSWQHLTTSGFGNNYTDIKTGTCMLLVESIGTESSRQFLSGNPGAGNFGSVTVKDSLISTGDNDVKNYWSVDYSGDFASIGNLWEVGAQDNTAYHRFKGMHSFYSLNNAYYNARNFIRVYDGGGTNLVSGGEEGYYNYIVPDYFNITSIGDRGGYAGAFVNLRGLMPRISFVGAMIGQVEPAVPGITYLKNGNPQRAMRKIQIDNTALTANAPSQTFVIATLPPKSKIVSVVADTTEAWTGPAGNTVLLIGDGGGTLQELIKQHSISAAPVTKGLSNADLGAWLVGGDNTVFVGDNVVQGGHFLNWSAVDSSISLRIATTVGNVGDGTTTNFTAGRTYIYLTTERLDN